MAADTTYEFQTLLQGENDDFCKTILTCSPQSSFNYNNICTISAFSKETTTPLSLITPNNASNRVVIVTSLCDRQPFETKVNKKLLINATDNNIQDNVVAMETNVRPLSLQLARYLLSRYVLYCRHGNDDCPNVWFICDDPNILALGLIINENKEMSLYQLINNSTKGPLVIKNKKSFSVNVNTLLPAKRHLQATPTQYNMYSCYEFGPSINSDNLKCQLSLEFYWLNQVPLLTPPPLETNRVILNILAEPGHSFSPVSAIFDEIQALVRFNDISAGTTDWSSLQVTSESDILHVSPTNNDLSTVINTFLLNANKTLKHTTPYSTTFSSPSLQSMLFQARSDLDFLDQLWLLCYNHIYNPNDLVNTFASIFIAVLKGKIQPFIHASSNSKCALLLRQVLAVDSADKREVLATKLQSLLTIERCLLTLIEIGIDKMERDYIFYFTSKELLSIDDIKLLAGTTLTERIRNLCSLHCILELIANMITYLSLSQTTLTLFTRKLVNYYKDNPVVNFQTTPTFSVLFKESTEIKYFSSFVANLTPINVTCHNDRYIFNATTEPLFKYTSINYEVKDDEETLYTYCTKCVSI